MLMLGNENKYVYPFGISYPLNICVVHELASTSIDFVILLVIMAIFPPSPIFSKVEFSELIGGKLLFIMQIRTQSIITWYK